MTSFFLLVTSSEGQDQPRGTTREPALLSLRGVRKMTETLYLEEIIQVQFWDYGANDTGVDDRTTGSQSLLQPG